MAQGSRNRFAVSQEIAYGVEAIHDRCLDIDRRQLWLHGISKAGPEYDGIEPGVEYLMVAQATKNLELFRQQSVSDPLLIHLQTCGGYWEQGMAIHNAISFMPFPVTMLVYTYARSMSSIILQAADHRVMMPDSYFMMHWGDMVMVGEARSVTSTVFFQTSHSPNDGYLRHESHPRSALRRKITPSCSPANCPRDGAQGRFLPHRARSGGLGFCR